MKTQANSIEDVIKTSSQKKSIIFDFTKTWIAYLVLIVMIIGSFLIKNTVQNRMDVELTTEFEKAYSSVISRLNNQYDRLSQVIRSTQGLYYQVVEVVRDYFEINGAVPVRNFSSIICLSYAPKVPYSYWAEFQWLTLCQGYNKFDLHPNVVRDYYYPVQHVVNYELNVGRLAFDYASIDVLKEAIELAQNSNTFASTEFFNLRPDTLSFALLAPIYQQGTNFSSQAERASKFIGSVVMEINAAKYFETAIKGGDVTEEDAKTVSYPTDSSIIFTINDINKDKKVNTIYKSSNESLLEQSGFTPMFTDTVKIEIANRELSVVFSTVPGFGATQANLPMIVFLLSLLLSVLAFILILVLVTQKARAEEIAERMTASQRRIVETSRDIIAVAASDGKWLSMNSASQELLGMPSQQVINTNFADFLHSDKELKTWQNVMANNAENQNVDFKIKSTKNTNGFLWINFNFSKPKNENLMYVIGRDVTIEREAAEEIKFRTKQIELANCYEQETAATKLQLMIQLSHEMRNQLTGMMGYLQLITNGAYDNEEELNSYASAASENAAAAFAYISDASEATIGDTDTSARTTLYRIEDTVLPVLSQYQKDKKAINVQFAENGRDAHVIADGAVIEHAWAKLFRILSLHNPNNEIHITANENKLEGVTEIIVEANSFEDLHKCIDIYNNSPEHVIERLKEDMDDIMLDIAKVDSFFKRMMGGFNIESMENGKTVYIFIMLPLMLRIKQA